jgi:predicted HAD superfamily Cof-like phosphohydrolase
MAQTKAKTTKAEPAKAPTEGTRSRVDTTAELSEDVLKAVESGQRAAIDAVHRFLEAVDEALPAIGERPSRREKVIDAALEMADKLTTTQYEVLRTVVRSAEKSLGTSPEAK